MGIVLDTSNVRLLGSYGQINFSETKSDWNMVKKNTFFGHNFKEWAESIFAEVYPYPKDLF